MITEEKFYYIKSKPKPIINGKTGEVTGHSQDILMTIGLFQTDYGLVRCCTMRSPRDPNNKELAKQVLRQRALQAENPDSVFKRKHYQNEFRYECIERLVHGSTTDELKKLMFPELSDVVDAQFSKICRNPCLTPFEKKIMGINN